MGEKIWHESQKAEKQPDGSLILTFQVAGLDEIKRWVLSLGPEAEVLAPPQLDEGIRQELHRTLQGYETSGLSADESVIVDYVHGSRV